jgi:uncharacterized iron-regulated protein
MRTILRLLQAATLALAACATTPPACPTHNQWITADSGRPTPDPLAHLPPGRIVLLGEQHDRAEDHHWQLAAITEIHAAAPNLVLGFEMFPRSTQPALNQWVAGTLSEDAFLHATDWQHVWGYPPALYMPIFRFARDHHIPMVALNVSRHLVHQVAQSGFATIPPADREGITTPAAPTDAYKARLAEAMSDHAGPKLAPDRLAHFIEAQQVWDRAMAEAIAAHQGPTLVAIMGAGHLQYGDGVPHQLAALGIPPPLVLLPAHDCTDLAPHYADALFFE